MQTGLVIYGFGLGAGPAIAFCETREQALMSATSHRTELLNDGAMDELRPTPIYRIVVRPLDKTLLLALLNDPEAHVARMIESIETVEFVSTPVSIRNSSFPSDTTELRYI